jgi:alkyl hydroperoxide reductase subunit D
MSIDALKEKIPDYAKDIRLNIGSIANDQTLSEQQIWGAMLASALACRNAELTKIIHAAAAEKLSPDALDGAKSAAAIMGMNNIYYRFVHIASNKDYQSMPAKLRMNVIGNPGVEKVDFELWSLAVSAINGCGMCIDAHEKQLLEHGITKDQVQTAVRIAAIIHAAATVLDGEAAAA